MTPEAKLLQHRERLQGVGFFEAIGQDEPAQHRNNLGINQIRRMQGLAGQPETGRPMDQQRINQH